MTDLIYRDDALECFMGYDRMGDVKDAIAALPAAKMRVKPLDQFGVRELARVSGISPTTAMRVKQGEGDLDGSTLRAVLVATGTCLCCGNSATLTTNSVDDSKTADPVVNGPAAIREAALREAAASIQWHITDLKHQNRGLALDLAVYGRDVVLALIGEKK